MSFSRLLSRQYRCQIRLRIGNRSRPRRSSIPFTGHTTSLAVGNEYCPSSLTCQERVPSSKLSAAILGCLSTWLPAVKLTMAVCDDGTAGRVAVVLEATFTLLLFF